MNKPNPLTGLVANYGDSDDDTDCNDVNQEKLAIMNTPPAFDMAHQPAGGIHPAPIPHCPWSACYDESSGFTYYWNQQTNAVTWEAPSEYLLALKVAQQQLHSAGTPAVSAEEWHLYQKALVDRKPPQSSLPKSSSTKLKADKSPTKEKNKAKKRTFSDEGKIELITSYHNSDSESNDESESPLKATPKEVEPPPAPPIQTAAPGTKAKHPRKKQKTTPIEFGPSLPPHQEYIAPIGPQLPSGQEYPVPIGPELPPVVHEEIPKTSENKEDNGSSKNEVKSEPLTENEDSQDENVLFQKLKDKAKLLEKLGGELPTELQKIIQEEEESTKNISPTSADKVKRDLDIDDLLEEIEKKELPKVKCKSKSKDIENKAQISNNSSITNSPIHSGYTTPPVEEIKALFPSSKAITEEITNTMLFPSAASIEQTKETKMELDVKEKKGTNLYLSNHNDTSKKKLRISNSVLPERKKTQFDVAAYTTKYAQYNVGVNERVGLGFSKQDSEDSSPKNTFSYGNGLTFTKGEVLNEEKKDEDLQDMANLVEAKLTYLNQLQPCVLTPVQEMLIQLQTLAGAFRGGALRAGYWRRWGAAALRALAAHEAAAAPPGWTLAFLRWAKYD